MYVQFNTAIFLKRNGKRSNLTKKITRSHNMSENQLQKQNAKLAKPYILIFGEFNHATS